MAEDINQIAARIREQSTSEQIKTLPPKQKNAAAVELGRLGGLKGGKARAQKLSARRMREIAKKGASARWGKKVKKT